MLDFSSALYLGLRHDAGSLRPWPQLTTGAPAALMPPPGARRLATRLAVLQGCEAATVAPSTLHVFFDLFEWLSAGEAVIYVDEQAYPIARWGAERALARGARLRRFPHHDATALRRALAADAPHRRAPIVLADGLCPGCGGIAPTRAYLEAGRGFGALLVLDDTQALGILGAAPGPDRPYGRGGGGTLRWHGVRDARILTGASLAKGFGVPIAVLAGSRELIARYESESETRVHCSPPSAAVLRAAERALDVNAARGDALRRRLASLVARFRRRLAAVGLRADGGLFPVQRLALPRVVDPERVQADLLVLGVRAVLTRGPTGGRPRVCLLISAAHTPADVDEAVRALAAVARPRVAP